MKLLVFLSFTFLYLLCDVSSLECYSCNTEKNKEVLDPHCKDLSASVNKVTCPDDDDDWLCFTVVPFNDTEITVRHCGDNKIIKMCKTLKEKGISNSTCFFCDTDLCNNSTTFYASLTTLVLSYLLKCLL